MLGFQTEPMPHHEAVDLIRDKPAVAREIFDALEPELRARAFTIAGIEDFDVLQGVQDSIAKLPAGGDWNKLRKEIAEKLSPWMDDARAANRAQLLLSHHGFAAYSAAHTRALDGMADIFTHRQYLATGDDATRASHQALDGIILPANHPFWEKHTPPWEWGCRCQVVGLTAEDAGEEAKADAQRPPDQRLVLGEIEQRMLDQGSLVRGINTRVDVRTPKERGGSYEWSPRQAVMPYEEIRKRWSPKVLAKFEAWAARQEVMPGSHLLQWLNPSPEARAGNPPTLGDLLAAAPDRAVAPDAFATLLRGDPKHPLAQVIKLWGDDEARFTEMMMLDTQDARQWRRQMEVALRKLQPVAGEPELYRGWSFATAAEMDAFLAEHREGFTQARAGMSATADIAVTAREKFTRGEHSMVWRIQGTRRAVDARPLFEAVGAVAHIEREEEFIFPRHTSLGWVSKDPELVEFADSAGNSREIRVYTLKEKHQ
jgi:SPP1 gp7 family putative phage head morphogenesis protein